MNEQQLTATFTRHEVETTKKLLACMREVPTTDMFRRLLMLFLRGHYSSKDNYQENFSYLGCYTWSDIEKDRTLHVGLSHQQDDNKPDNYPGIYVGFAGTGLEKLVIGNFAGESRDQATRILTKQAKTTFKIKHVAKEASNAMDLAEMSAHVLTAMAAPLALNSGATGFEVKGYHEPKGKNPSPKDYYTVALDVEILYNHTVTRSLESHRIRRITQELESDH